MALWDNADLLSRVKVLALRPANDLQMPDATWYSLLSEAQAVWQPVFAAHFPNFYWSALTQMTSADNGATYQFNPAGTPLRVEIYDSPTGNLLRPGAYWDGSAGYVWEGSQIRFPEAQTMTFPSGAPWARVITAPIQIDASTQPTLLPSYARILLVYRAVAEWALRGGLRDPAPFKKLEQEAWYDPATGTGILVQLKSQNPFLGAAAFMEPQIMPMTDVMGIS